MSADLLSLADVAELTSKAMPEDAWDSVPLLGLVQSHANGDTTVQGLPIPTRMWQDRHPVVVLDILTRLMQADPPEREDIPGVTLIGLLSMTEGYAARPPEGTSKEDVFAFEVWAESHPIDDHPWSKESRDTIIVGFDGSLHWVNHVRGTDTHDATSFQHLDDWPSGRLVESLRGFALAVKEALA